MTIDITFIAGWIRKFRVWNLKRRARKFYMQHLDILGQYSCGSNLASYMSVRAVRIAEKFNYAMDRLTELDPDTPKERL